ncbi:hypothetical protein KSS87_009837, partial [Heliosperma pusillum]
MESGSTHIANWVIWVRKQRKIVNWAQQVKLMKKAQVFKSINQGRNLYKKENSPPFQGEKSLLQEKNSFVKVKRKETSKALKFSL